jgi:hypothetical protein
MIEHHKDLIQGSEEWHEARCGLLTASEMKLIITPGNLRPAQNDKQRAHLYELLAQRISGYVEPSYVSDDMMRGQEDEQAARDLYNFHYAPTDIVGFITNDKWGYKIGYSPDALVGDDGAIEIKSRRQKYQVETILNNEVPQEYMIQIQTGLMVTERKWCDFISYSAGLPMFVKRVDADIDMQNCIISAADTFMLKINDLFLEYKEKIKPFHNTERKIEQEMHV